MDSTLYTGTYTVEFADYPEVSNRLQITEDGEASLIEESEEGSLECSEGKANVKLDQTQINLQVTVVCDGSEQNFVIYGVDKNADKASSKFTTDVSSSLFNGVAKQEATLTRTKNKKK